MSCVVVLQEYIGQHFSYGLVTRLFCIILYTKIIDYLVIIKAQQTLELRVLLWEVNLERPVGGVSSYILTRKAPAPVSPFSLQIHSPSNSDSG